MGDSFAWSEDQHNEWALYGQLLITHLTHSKCHCEEAVGRRSNLQG